MTLAERTERGVAMENFWGRQSTNTRDRATAMMPRMLYDRADELGIDFGVVYPTAGLGLPRIADDATRRAVIRGFNVVTHEYFKDLGDKLTPAAVIPVHTPDEAIEELTFVTSQLGAKVCMFGSAVRRPIPHAKGAPADLARYAQSFDQLGLDSEYDYDPLWQKCRELGIAPAFHSSAMGWQNRASISSYVYNHVGMLGESHHALAKSLFLGGVTRRFPDLNFGFLEGGVAWAATLYADLVGHFEKRSGEAMRRLDPTNVDWDEFAELFAKYGGDWAPQAPKPTTYPEQDVALLDEFAAVGIESAEEIRDLFAVPFYCGCEADDPMTVTAFNTKANPFGARFNAMFGSDISHWDVPVMADVLGEVYEMVEHELFTDADLRDFVFTNPVRFYTHQNPDFFAGTVVEGAVKAELQ
jgi:predicted TIM-barrel fold metal-dependent hydrolase